MGDVIDLYPIVKTPSRRNRRQRIIAARVRQRKLARLVQREFERYVDLLPEPQNLLTMVGLYTHEAYEKAMQVATRRALKRMRKKDRG